jgi:hypothetical protein
MAAVGSHRSGERRITIVTCAGSSPAGPRRSYRTSGQSRTLQATNSAVDDDAGGRSSAVPQAAMPPSERAFWSFTHAESLAWQRKQSYLSVVFNQQPLT